MTAFSLLYVVEAPDGRLYGPFNTNDASVPANQELTDGAITDAQWFASQNNMGGASVITLLPPSSWVPPIPEADTTG